MRLGRIENSVLNIRKVTSNTGANQHRAAGPRGLITTGFAAALLLATFATLGVSATAYANTTIDGCTIVSNPTPTTFTDCAGDNLTGANLSGLNLSYADLQDVALTQCTLMITEDMGVQGQCAVANLERAKLVDANLSGASTSSCASENFGAPWYEDSVCAGANMMNTVARGANFTGDDLSWNYFLRTDLDGATFTGATFSECAPATIGIYGEVCGETNFQNAKIENTDLSGLQLVGVSLESANLTGSNLANANLTPLQGPAETHGPYLVKTNLTGANLDGADFAGDTISRVKVHGAQWDGANLSDTTILNVNLAGDDLSGVTLTGITSGQLKGHPPLPANWLLANGYLIGPTAVLFDANLRHVRLATADLTGVSSGGVTGPLSSLPPNWVLVDGYLVGPGADLNESMLKGANLANDDLIGASLADADLKSADLAGADLTGDAANNTSIADANLTNTNLTNVDLSYSSIDDAMVTGTTFTGVTWMYTTCPDGTSSQSDGDTCINNLG